jgi:hypothetical protein
VNRPVKRLLHVSGIILECMILSAASIRAIAALYLDFPIVTRLSRNSSDKFSGIDK